MNSWSLQPDRRSFFMGAGASAACFVAQACFSSEGPGPESSSGKPKATGPRILSLELLSAAPLAKMREFYHDLHGLAVLEEKPQRLTIAAGETRITFVKVESGDEKPFYHFAFNIPENKIVAARQWQRERTPLLPIPRRLRDPKYPDDVVDYRHWNAHSVFFLDPAENVVEYIARHDLHNAVGGDFGSADILYASEIALIVDDVPTTAVQVREVVGIHQYRGGDEQFTALGDEHGLLLVMKRGRLLSFDHPEKKAAGIFRTAANVRGLKRTKYAFPKFPYEISVDG